MFEFGKTGYLLNELSLYSTTGLFSKTQSAEDATGPKVAGTIFFCQPAPTREQLPYTVYKATDGTRTKTRDPTTRTHGSQLLAATGASRAHENAANTPDADLCNCLSLIWARPVNAEQHIFQQRRQHHARYSHKKAL